jgi:hypothetical protein
MIPNAVSDVDQTSSYSILYTNESNDVIGMAVRAMGQTVTHPT